MAVQEISLLNAREKIKNRINQAGSSKYSDSFLNDFLNEAQTLIATHTDCLESTEDITLVSSQPDYDIPAEWFRTIMVRYEGAAQNELLIPGTVRDYMSMSTITTGAIPKFFVVDDVEKKLLIYPTPTSTDNLRHDYIIQPEELIADGDILLNGIKRLYRYHNDVVSLTVNMIKALEKGALPDEAIAPFAAKLNAMRNDITVKVRAKVQQHKIFGDGDLPRVRLPSNYPCN
jgi:hypothetical protein